MEKIELEFFFAIVDRYYIDPKFLHPRLKETKSSIVNSIHGFLLRTRTRK